ncbi:MAG: hypothetical protein HQL66_12255 [Magnetococcales bacterium]|nr:hypothetical protein [Magnetococcales bacterium]
MNRTIATTIIILGTLLTTPGHAQTPPCTTAAAEQAVRVASEIVDRLGVKAAKQTITGQDARFRCGISTVKVISHRGVWVIDPEDPTNVGTKVSTLRDGAAINFMNSLIRQAIDKHGALGSYFVTDTENGKKINKALYYINVPKRRVVVYGGFIVD